MSEDFGYTEDDNSTKKQVNKMQELEDLILPLIDNLIKTSDKDIIKWPNRKGPLEELRAKIIKLTRN